ncbi:TIM barrel protein [Actinosynnema sp. NPDC020468]|uniref:sugar phosphate isomerase/epimerase family protein n=1 Tax=Actinosynnema sp. NPDC020468 TaxID=3154488 RepID=UPI0034052E89
MPGELAGLTDEAAPDLATQLAVLDELGWSAIELRTVDHVPIAALTDRAFAAVADALAVRGVRTVGVASRIGGWCRPVTGPFADDLAELEVLSRRCAVLGTRYVRIMSYPNDGLPERQWRERAVARVAVLAELAGAAGLVLLHENCAGWVGGDPRRTLDLLGEVASPALKLLFDTGNGVAHGYDGYALLAQVVDHVAHVHVKDATPEGFVPPGEGDARVADCVALLRAEGYRGAWTLEPHLAALPHPAAPALRPEPRPGDGARPTDAAPAGAPGGGPRDAGGVRPADHVGPAGGAVSASGVRRGSGSGSAVEVFVGAGRAMAVLLGGPRSSTS